MNVYKWRRLANEVKGNLGLGEIELHPEIVLLIQSINKRSAFFTFWSKFTLDKEETSFFVDFYIIPNDAGWNALEKLIQGIYAYNKDGHDIFLSFDSVAGIRSNLSFFIMGKNENPTELAE